MKKRLLFCSLVAVFMVTVITSQASADIITGCLKVQGSAGKLKRFAVGEDPTRECNRNHQLIRIPLLQQNSSLIGGDIGEEDIGVEEGDGPGDETLYSGMFGSESDPTEDDVTQNMAASGALTNLFARSEPPGEGNTLTVTIRKDLADTFLGCTISQDDTCTDTSCGCNVASCVDFAQGDLISVELSYVGAVQPDGVSDIRWNARFVESATCELLGLESGGAESEGESESETTTP